MISEVAILISEVNMQSRTSYELDMLNYELDILSWELDILSYELDIWSYELDLLSYELDILSYRLDIHVLSCQLNRSSQYVGQNMLQNAIIKALAF